MKTDATSLIRDVAEALRQAGISFEVLTKGGREESSAVEWLERRFPIEPWGRVNWNRVKDAYCKPWATWEEMNDAYEDLLVELEKQMGHTDASLFLIWSNAARPILRVPFAALRECGAAILDEDSDVWILCPAEGWCIEKYHEGELCYGRADTRE